MDSSLRHRLTGRRQSQRELEQTESDLTHRMPPQLKPLWDALYDEVVWLHALWRVFKQIFVHSQRRLDILNERAGTLFYLMHNAFAHEVLLTLSKLGDPAKSSVGTNLTLESLLLEIERLGESKLSRSLHPLFDEYHAACKKTRPFRNKVLAHYDRATLLAAKIKPLPGPSRKEIEESLRLLRTFMNRVDNHFNHTTTAFEEFNTNDGDYLVTYLKQAMRYEQLISHGRIEYDDLEKSDLFEV